MRRPASLVLSLTRRCWARCLLRAIRPSPVTFTPTDTTDYSTATATVILVVLNAPTIASLSLPQGPPQMGLTIGGLFLEQRREAAR